MYIDTSQITDDLSWEYDSVYCTNCGSCGQLGCECWAGCTAMHCKYGTGLIVQYDSLKEDCDKYYLMLMELGIDPFHIDLDNIKKVAESTYDGISVREHNDYFFQMYRTSYEED